jgi:hypothetical protein
LVQLLTDLEDVIDSAMQRFTPSDPRLLSEC